MKTLVVNQGYMPLYKTSWKKAITLWVKGKAEIVQTYKKVIYENAVKGIILYAPKVIRLISFMLPSDKGKYLPFSKGNLYMRDNGYCGYCRKKLTIKAATIDHVIPTSRGGKSSWENVVLSCRKCNSKKANKTPTEAGMELKARLFAPAMTHKWLADIKPIILPNGEFVYDW